LFFSLIAFLSLSSPRRTGANQSQHNYSKHLSIAAVFLYWWCWVFFSSIGTR
jgi:hypothetical protein